MAPTTRKKAPVKAQLAPNLPKLAIMPPTSALPKSKYKDNDPFEQTFNSLDDDMISDHDSDHSDYSKPNKKRKRPRGACIHPRNGGLGRKRLPPAPPLSDVSDHEYAAQDTDSDENTDPFKCTMLKAQRNSQDLPTTPGSAGMMSLQITGDHATKTLFNFNLGDILRDNMYFASPGELTNPRKRRRSEAVADSTSLVEAENNSGGKRGFLDLPSELRVRVYRLVFRSDAVADFDARINLSHSSAFLRTCRTVHEEGREILYGENSFHFARNTATRGTYWQQTWTEIGFKDTRRFLEAIGPKNISCLKHISFWLSDALQTGSYRKFIDDATLQHIFRLIGAHTILRKLAVMFNGRAGVSAADFHFLKAFTEMKCNELIFINCWRHHTSRSAPGLQAKLKSVMQVADQSPALTLDRQTNKVKMVYEDGSYVQSF